MVKEKKQINTWDKAGIWPAISEHTTKAARLSIEEKTQLSESLVAEIITATAYISGCTDPDRIAIAHLTTFIAAIRCPEVYGHRKGESLAKRLLAGNYYPGGDPDVVKAGMLLLELISLNDHRHDFQEDLVSGKANPLVTDLNYDEERERIMVKYAGLDSAIQKNFEDLYSKVIICGNWAGSNPLSTNLNYDEERKRIEKEWSNLDLEIQSAFEGLLIKTIKCSNWL